MYEDVKVKKCMDKGMVDHSPVRDGTLEDTARIQRIDICIHRTDILIQTCEQGTRLVKIW